MKLDLNLIKERLGETSFKEAYVKGDAWKGYEVKDENNDIVLAEVSCGTDAEFFANARKDVTELLVEIDRLGGNLETIYQLTECVTTKDFAKRSLDGTATLDINVTRII
ncbi:hypothetical protein [Rossellomorea marisflavi]|uniref:hypothetical protein n=1 Tax=Rossellomorea marisflavi TaxID=189381 RepID=UPI003F9F827A